MNIMNESHPTRAHVDRAARRNYVILCITATIVLVAMVVASIVFVGG
jgi:hypothetical protein